MRSVVGADRRVFARAVVMPNLRPPVTTVAVAAAYRERIAAALPRGSRFAPLMTLYLTDRTSPRRFAARGTGFIVGIKYYPAGATTNSDSGVTDLRDVVTVLGAMEEAGCRCSCTAKSPMPTSTSSTASAFSSIDCSPASSRDFPALNIVLEHVTTAEAASSCRGAGATSPRRSRRSTSCSRATLCCGRDPPALLLPADPQARVASAGAGAAATAAIRSSSSAPTRAPHARHAKESACGCAGCYSAPVAIELYAEAFEAAGALDRLEAFASFHGAGLLRPAAHADTVTLRARPGGAVRIAFGDETVVPLRAGETRGLAHRRRRRVIDTGVC